MLGSRLRLRKMKRRPTTLIKSPLAWHMANAPVLHPALPVLAERGGTQLKTPRATVLVDTREQNPFDFSRFDGWFAGVEKKALQLGDYSIAGLEHACVVERKDLGDLVHSLTAARVLFVSRLKKISAYPHRLLVITATLSSIKSSYAFSNCNPNQIMQALIAVLAGWGVPFVCTETHELGEEIIASYLYQVHLYHWLDSNGHGRYLADQDL
jgi:ERCC4-type nuclease